MVSKMLKYAFIFGLINRRKEPSKEVSIDRRILTRTDASKQLYDSIKRLEETIKKVTK